MPRGVPRWKTREPPLIPPIPMDDNLVFLWECLQYSDYRTVSVPPFLPRAYQIFTEYYPRYEMSSGFYTIVLQANLRPQIDFKTVGRAFQMTRDEALECFKDLRRAIEHAICQDFIEKSNAQRARAGLSSSSILLRANDGRGPSNNWPSNNSGPSNTTQISTGPSNGNPAGVGSSNAGPSNTVQSASQHRQNAAPVVQTSENARKVFVAVKQASNVSSTAPVNSTAPAKSANSADSAAPSNTGSSNARASTTGQTTGNSRFAPVQTSQTFSHPRASPFNAGPSAGPSSVNTILSNTGQQAPRSNTVPSIQPFNLPRAGPVLLDMTGLGCFLGRTESAPAPNMANTGIPRTDQSTNTTGASSVAVAEAGSSNIGDLEDEKPPVSSERVSTSPTKNDKGKKRKRVSESEGDMDVDKSVKKKGTAK